MSERAGDPGMGVQIVSNTETRTGETVAGSPRHQHGIVRPDHTGRSGQPPEQIGMGRTPDPVGSAPSDVGGVL